MLEIIEKLNEKIAQYSSNQLYTHWIVLEF